MARTMIAIWGNRTRCEWVRAPGAARGWGAGATQGYLQGRHVVGQPDGDGRLHVQDVVVPEKIPQLFLVLIDHLDHPGQDKVQAPQLPSSAAPRSLPQSGHSAQFLLRTPKVHPHPHTKPWKIEAHPARIALYFIGLTIPSYRILFDSHNRCNAPILQTGRVRCRGAGSAHTQCSL